MSGAFWPALHADAKGFHGCCSVILVKPPGDFFERAVQNGACLAEIFVNVL